MKLETLAKRLARGTNTPGLEQIILNQRDIRELPLGCMIWTGTRLGSSLTLRQRISKSKRDGLCVDFVQDKPQGVINWNGKRIAVQRLIFQLITKPDYEFRMWNQCGTPFCVHPIHYEVQQLTEDKIPQPNVSLDPWTPEEMEEVMEILLTENQPRNWEDVVGHPLLEGAPEDMLRQTLLDMNKEYLTWT